MTDPVCTSCMKHRPSLARPFTCPDCGSEWVLAGVAPGNYYERRSTHDEEKKRANKLIEELGQ